MMNVDKMMKWTTDRIALLGDSLRSNGFVNTVDGKALWEHDIGSITWKADFVKDDEYGNGPVIMLSGVSPKERRKGAGTRLLRMFLQGIDCAKLLCWCVPMPYLIDFDGMVLTGVAPDDGLDKDELVNWYVRNGFKVSRYLSEHGNTSCRYVPHDYIACPY